MGDQAKLTAKKRELLKVFAHLDATGQLALVAIIVGLFPVSGTSLNDAKAAGRALMLWLTEELRRNGHAGSERMNHDHNGGSNKRPR